MPANVARYSRLAYSTLYSVSNGTEDIEFFDLPRPPRALPAATDLIYTVQSSDSIGNKSYERYGDVIVWDVIADINMMWELPQEFATNVIIRMPSKARLFGELRG